MPIVSVTTTDLPEARVRLEVTVSEQEVEQRLEQAAKKMASDMKLPGFREGKVPPEVVKQRLGKPAILEQAINDGLPYWYDEAVRDAKIAPVGSPKLNVKDAEPDGGSLELEFEIPVRPAAKLGEYEGIEVGKGEAKVEDDDVEQQLKALRDQFARLETVERPAHEGDFVVIDFVGKKEGEVFEGGSAKDYVLELGSGKFIPGFEEQLTGTSAGEDVEVKVTFPEDYGNEGLAGAEAVFDVTNKEVREKKLRELDNEFAEEVAGFDSIDELREDIRSKLLERSEQEVEGAYRSAVVDAVAKQADVEVPHGHIHSRSHDMWHNMANNLAQQGIDPRQYLAMTGKTEEELVVEAEPEAELSLKREAALQAVIEQQEIEVSDDELREALVPMANEQKSTPDEMLSQVRAAGRIDELKEDLAQSKAVDHLVAAAKPIDLTTAAAREQMWTPEKEAKESKGKLWTPGS